MVSRRKLRIKVWIQGEREPEESFDRFPGAGDVSDAWLEENPSMAAELYALHRFEGKWRGVVQVRLPNGNLHDFDVFLSDPYTTRDILIQSRDHEHH